LVFGFLVVVFPFLFFFFFFFGCKKIYYFSFKLNSKMQGKVQEVKTPLWLQHYQVFRRFDIS